MKKKFTSYPGFSILFCIGKYRKYNLEIDNHSIKLNFLFFTIMVVKKDLNMMLESYLESLLTRIKELENNTDVKK